MPLTASPMLIQLLRIVHVDQRERVVIRRHADFEDTHHAKLLETRHHAGRRDLALRGDQQYAFAYPRAQRARQVDPSTMPNSPPRRLSSAPAFILPLSS